MYKSGYENRIRYWTSKGIDRTIKTVLHLTPKDQQELISAMQKTKMTVSAKTATVEKDDYSNTYVYLVYQNYSENQNDNAKAWKNYVGEASSIIPYSQDIAMNFDFSLPWTKGD